MTIRSYFGHCEKFRGVSAVVGIEEDDGLEAVPNLCH